MVAEMSTYMGFVSPCSLEHFELSFRKHVANIPLIASVVPHKEKFCVG